MKLIIDLSRHEKEIIREDLDLILFNDILKILNSSQNDNHLELANIGENLAEYLYI